jgi:flagellar basal body-associated protein FliL
MARGNAESTVSERRKKIILVLSIVAAVAIAAILFLINLDNSDSDVRKPRPDRNTEDAATSNTNGNASNMGFVLESGGDIYCGNHPDPVTEYLTLSLALKGLREVALKSSSLRRVNTVGSGI